MAYISNNLSALSYANGFTLWHYKSIDNSNIIDTVGYFNKANKILRIGDFIFINASIDAIPNYGVVVVVANSNGLVNVSDIVSFGNINSD